MRSRSWTTFLNICIPFAAHNESSHPTRPVTRICRFIGADGEVAFSQAFLIARPLTLFLI